MLSTFGGGECGISEYSKYSQFRLWPIICQMQELTMILLSEDELGSAETNFPPMSFLPTNLAFQTRTYISNFPKSLDIEHFLTASTRNWSISNILQEIDCSSKIKVWTSIDPWQHLSPVRSKSWSEVEKTHSHAGLDWLLSGFSESLKWCWNRQLVGLNFLKPCRLSSYDLYKSQNLILSGTHKISNLAMSLRNSLRTLLN